MHILLICASVIIGTFFFGLDTWWPHKIGNKLFEVCGFDQDTLYLYSYILSAYSPSVIAYMLYNLIICINEKFVILL